MKDALSSTRASSVQQLLHNYLKFVFRSPPMAIACFDQFEGLLELAKPALEALTPRRLKSITTPKVNPAVVVPATVVCRAKGDGVPAGLLCRVSVQGELLISFAAVVSDAPRWTGYSQRAIPEHAYGVSEFAAVRAGTRGSGWRTLEICLVCGPGKAWANLSSAAGCCTGCPTGDEGSAHLRPCAGGETIRNWKQVLNFEEEHLRF
eukprot:g28656.t1